MAASSKQYGRSNSSLMDSIFTKQVSSDPFLFDSGGSDGDSQPSLNTSKKKFKQIKKLHRSTKSRKVSRKQTSDFNSWPKQSGDCDRVGGAEEGKEVPSRKHNTRSRCDSSTDDRTMQITSTTVHHTVIEEGSDYENAAPVMSITSETVHTSCLTDDTGYNSYINNTSKPQNTSNFSQKPSFLNGSQPAVRYRRSSNASVSSADSQGSASQLHRQESDRLKQFLSGGNGGETTASSTHSSDSNVSTRSLARRRVPTEKYQQYLNSNKVKTKQKTNETSKRKKQILPQNTNNSANPNKRVKLGHDGPRESDRLKQFLNSDTNVTPEGDNSSQRVHLDLIRTESDRLKKFLESGNTDKYGISDSESVKSEHSMSSVTSFDLTVVSRNTLDYPRSVKESEDCSTVSDNLDSCSTTSLELTIERQESDRLQQFLSSGTSETANSTSGCGNKTHKARRVNGANIDRLRKPGASSKVRSVVDEFSFTADSIGDCKKDMAIDKVMTDEGTSRDTNKLCSSFDSKPIINFEKMEGKKEKMAPKTSKKLLSSPAKVTSKYRYNPRAWLADPVDDEEAGDSRDGIVKSHSQQHTSSKALRHPLELKKVVKYPDHLGERISTQLKVPQAHKKLYTVVKNVRQAHECQDHGETQQIDDDLEFLVDGLKPVGATSSRYLSAISLAKKCTNPTFRMCLRSNSGLSHIFTSLSDAPTEPRLALSTTAIMFMLCQDRLNMDLDRDSLQLMVDLLEYDDGARLHNPQELSDYERSIDTVYELYKSSIPDGEELVDRNELSPGYLAMECLLVLTSRRSGDWFKEELREVGALHHIASSIVEKTTQVMLADYTLKLSAHLLTLIKKICRGLRVLEHVTACNTGNQRQVIEHQGGEFAISLCRLLMFGVEAISIHSIDTRSSATSSGNLIFQLMLGVLRVLVNITHDSKDGCTLISSFSGVVSLLLRCVLQTPQYVLEEQRFDLLVLSIGLSINMCENSCECRQILLDSETMTSYDSVSEKETMTSVEALLGLFDQRLLTAEKIEAETGDLRESDVVRAVNDDLSESITEVLHKAGRHMEDSIVASYIALLIGVILQHSPDYIDHVKQFLRGKSFSQIISVLQKFLSFMKMADAASGNTGSKSIGTVLGFLREYT